MKRNWRRIGVPKKRRSKDDDWIDALLKLGLGAIALSILGKLIQGGQPQEITACPYCGQQIQKWARFCPRCRASLSF